MAQITFQANFSCFIGNRGIVTGEPLVAILTANGTYALFRMVYRGKPEDDPIAWLNADDIDKLAGRDVTDPDSGSGDDIPFTATCALCGRVLDLDELYCDHSNPEIEAIEAQS